MVTQTDTQERIDAFLDASWEQLSVRAKNMLIFFGCKSPADLKAVIENNFATKRRAHWQLGPKTKAELIAFYEEFEKNHPAEKYRPLSPREQMEYNLRRNATFLKEDDIEFVLSYLEQNKHFPMFFVFSKYFEYSDLRRLSVIRDYLGICAEPKTKEQIMEIYHISKGVLQTELSHAEHSIGEVAIWRMKKVFDDWEKYEVINVLFNKPVLTEDEILPAYQTITENEHLHMSLECFKTICSCLFFNEIKGKDRAWYITSEDVSLFDYAWMIKDVRAASKKKGEMFFDLKEYCNNPENWHGEKVIRKALPAVLDLSKQLIENILHLPVKGNKIILREFSKIIQK